jgi:DNA-binding XRE family transcriptional regulator
MGTKQSVKTYLSPKPRRPPPLPLGLVRRKPRAYYEWKTLRGWGQLPDWEESPPGYLLREARERTGLTQAELGERLGCSQQAVARAERWESNPTVAHLRKWAEACRASFEMHLSPHDGPALAPGRAGRNAARAGGKATT